MMGKISVPKRRTIEHSFYDSPQESLAHNRSQCQRKFLPGIVAYRQTLKDHLV